MIEIITVAYNEEKLLPFFLNYYSFADAIHMIIDEDTTDNSREICKQCPNVRMHSIVFPGIMDEGLKVARINEVAKTCQDFIVVVDIDEFVFSSPSIPLKKTIETLNLEAIYVNFWQVYRNEKEGDLDPSLPPLLQRRHGDPRLGWYRDVRNNKPLIINRKYEPEWQVGTREVNLYRPPTTDFRWTTIYGAHWVMADVEIAVERAKSRQSKNNRAQDCVIPDWHITEEEIREECDAMLDAPQLF
jgi:hypothetical protein